MQWYRHTNDLTSCVPVFPLRRVILLPGTSFPLHIFEPRYLEMVNHILASSRIIGLVQPVPDDNDPAESPDNNASLHQIGCAGRLTAFNENPDGTLHISLTGVCRFKLVSEIPSDRPFRSFEADYSKFENDLERGYGESSVDRGVLLSVLRAYLKANDMTTDWDSIHHASTEHIVNTLSVLSPYGCEEKQALLEAFSLKERADILIALAEMDLASGRGSGSSNLQ